MNGPAGWSFDSIAEAAMTTARPPLSLIVYPYLSLLSTDYCLSPCCHTLRHCSLTVGPLCLRREEWDHDPPAVTTRNLVHVLFIGYLGHRVALFVLFTYHTYVEWPRYIERGRKVRCWLGGQLLFFLGDFSFRIKTSVVREQ